MKKIVLIALCLFGMTNIGSARIVEIHRSNGFFGFYGSLDQTYMGLLNGEAWWILICKGWGTTRCKLSPTAGKTSHELAIEFAENTELDNLMASIETGEINNGNETGQQTKHYQTKLDDESVVDIYISITWQPDPNDSGNTIFHANINNSES